MRHQRNRHTWYQVEQIFELKLLKSLGNTSVAVKVLGIASKDQELVNANEEAV